ncbi:MAG: phospholipase [Thermoleophilia bacterium]|nr:phospholipase [Thermoleophilia bacterium]
MWELWDVGLGSVEALRAIRGPVVAGKLANAVHGHAALPENVLVAGAGELLVDKDLAVARLLGDIAGAKRSIEIAEYILQPTREGRQILEALRARVKPTDGRAPIEVSVLIDRQGSGQRGVLPQKIFYDRLERDGIRLVRHESPVLPMFPPIEHRKLFVIDDDIAHVGGMGFGSGTSWHDVMVRLTGREIVAQAHADFVGRWVDNGGQVSTLQRQMLEQADLAGQTPVDVGYRLVANDGPVRDATRAIYALADTAQERLWMQTPYFGSPRIVDASHAAIARGADTKLWVNGDASAFPLFQQLSRSYYGDLGAGAAQGVRVLEQPQMSHEKIVLTEDWATIGSTNLTYRALDTDHELNVLSNDPALMGQVDAMMRHDESRAHLVTGEDMQRLRVRLMNAPVIRPIVRRTLESMA